MKNNPVFFGLQPEQELVLNSIRLDHSKDDLTRELLQRDLDWTAVQQIAEFNGVLPLLLQSLKRGGQEYVPAEVMSSIEQIYQANGRRTLRLALKLLHLLDLFNSQGIDCIPFKGPALAIQAYGDLYLRYFTDLDILVHKRDIPRIYPLMADSGYCPEVPVGVIGPKRLSRVNKDFHFGYQGDFLELHGEVVEEASAYPIDPEYFWDGHQTIQLLGREIPALSPENNLLMACMQATIDRWGSLKWIADMAHLCQASTNVDWLALLEEVKRLGFYRTVCLSLQLAEEPGGATFPPEVRDRFLADPTAILLADQVRSQLVTADETTNIFGNAGFFLRSRERYNHRLYYILNQAFIPKPVDWISVPLSDSLSPLYYFIRPIRLLIKFGRLLLSQGVQAGRIQADRRVGKSGKPINGQVKDLVLANTELVDLMRQFLSRGMPFRFRARGWSMTPFIQDGDAISVAPFRQNRPGLGEVAVYVQPQTGHLVVHRVIGKRGRACLIQGDNVASGPDGLVLPESLLGRVTKVERNGRLVWLGLGPERYLIALFSRKGLLMPILRRAGTMLPRVFRKSG
jgi:hypothetical protein